MERSQNEIEIERAVLRYLSKHPQAADTTVGIAEWWLTQHPGITVPKLQRLLDRLAEKGVLETIGDDNRRCYRLKS